MSAPKNKKQSSSPAQVGQTGQIHNVLVGGNSIGLTPDRATAESWARSSMSNLKVQIHTVNHTIDPKYFQD